MVERKTLNLVVVGSSPTEGVFLNPPPLPPEGCRVVSVVIYKQSAALAQLGERQTEDLKVPGSIPGGGTFCYVRLPLGRRSIPTHHLFPQQ